jgi:hypothetical protein
MKPLIFDDKGVTKTYAWVNHFVDINEHTAARVPLAYYRNIDKPSDEVVFNSKSNQVRSVNIKEDMARRNRRPTNGDNS